MKLIKWLLILFIWLALFSSIAVTWSLLNLPETESIQISRQPSITFLDKDGRIIASYGDVYGQSIQFSDLPEKEAIDGTVELWKNFRGFMKEFFVLRGNEKDYKGKYLESYNLDQDNF